MKQRVPAKRQAAKALQVMLTADERAAFDRLCKERNVSLRELVVGSVLGSEPTNLLHRILQIEARLDAIDGRVVLVETAARRNADRWPYGGNQ